MSRKFLLIGIIILVIVVLLFMFYQYKKNSRAKRGLVSSYEETNQSFLDQINYEYELNKYIINTSTLPCEDTNIKFPKTNTYDDDYLTNWSPIYTPTNSYTIKFDFSELVRIKKIRIYSGYKIGDDWTKVIVKKCSSTAKIIGCPENVNTINCAARSIKIVCEYNNRLSNKDLNYSYYDYNEIDIVSLDLDKHFNITNTCILEFISSTAINIREIVFLGYDVWVTQNIELNGYKINPVLSNAPQDILGLYNNIYNDIVTYNKLEVYKIWDYKLQKYLIRLVVPFDKIYYFYKITIHSKIGLDGIGYKFFRITGDQYSNKLKGTLLQAPLFKEDKTHEENILFVPIMDNKLVLDFIDPDSNLSLINIDFYGFDVDFSYYDQILITNTKQQTIDLAEIQVFNEKFENILPSYINENKAKILQVPTNTAGITRIEITKDVNDVTRKIIDENYFINYTKTLSPNNGNEELSIPFIRDFGSIKNASINIAHSAIDSETVAQWWKGPLFTITTSNNITLFSFSLRQGDVNYGSGNIPISHVYYSISINLFDQLKNISKSDFPLKINFFQWTKVQLLLVYYKNYNFLYKINEIMIYHYDDKGQKKLYPKYDSNNNQNYQILSNSYFGFFPSLMKDYNNQKFDDVYYKSNVTSTQNVTITINVGKRYIKKVGLLLNKPDFTITSRMKINYYRTDIEMNCLKEVSWKDPKTNLIITGCDEYKEEEKTIKIIESNFAAYSQSTKNTLIEMFSSIYNGDINNDIAFLSDPFPSRLTSDLLVSKIKIIFYNVSVTDQVEIKSIKLIDGNNNEIPSDRFSIEATNFALDGSIENLSDGNESTYFRNSIDPIKLFVLFKNPINLEGLTIKNTNDIPYKYSLIDCNIKFYDYLNKLSGSLKINNIRSEYNITRSRAIDLKNYISNLYDNNLNTYNSTIPELYTYKKNNDTSNNIISPYILILFNEPVILTGIKLFNMTSLFLNDLYRQADNNMTGTYVYTSLGPKWNKINYETPFKCSLSKATDNITGIVRDKFVAYKINKKGNSECLSIDGIKCEKYNDIKSCVNDTFVMTKETKNIECGTGIDYSLDCNYYQKNIRKNEFCLNVKNDKYIKIINDLNSNKISCKSNDLSNNLCVEYNSKQLCENDISVNFVRYCTEENLKNPNHWCNLSLNEISGNKFNSIYRVFDISGKEFPKYCYMDIKPLSQCVTEYKEYNNITKSEETIHSSSTPFKVIIGDIKRIPMDMSGNMLNSSTGNLSCEEVANLYTTSIGGIRLSKIDYDNKKAIFIGDNFMCR